MKQLIVVIIIAIARTCKVKVQVGATGEDEMRLRALTAIEHGAGHLRRSSEMR